MGHRSSGNLHNNNRKSIWIPSVHVSPEIVHKMLNNDRVAHGEIRAICRYALEAGRTKGAHNFTEEEVEDTISTAIQEVLYILKHEDLDWDSELSKALRRVARRGARQFRRYPQGRWQSRPQYATEGDFPNEKFPPTPDFFGEIAGIDLVQRLAASLDLYIEKAIEKITAPQFHDILVKELGLEDIGLELRDKTGGNLPSNAKSWGEVLSHAWAIFFEELRNVVRAEDPEYLVVLDRMVRRRDFAQILVNLQSLAEKY